MDSIPRTFGTDMVTISYSNMNMVNGVHNVTTEYSCCSDESPASHAVPSLAVPSVMFCLGVIGNVTALIILTVKPSKDIKATAFYHLVKALACMDLFGIVAASPVTIIVYIKGGVLETGGLALCNYISIILIMAGNGTLYTVLVMAAERFIVTKYPFKYSQVVTPMVVNSSIFVVWCVSLFIALLPIMGVGRNTARWPGTWCFFDYRSTTILGKVFSYFYAVVGLLVISITLLLNLTVIHHLWRMRKSRLVKFASYTTEDYPQQHGGPDSEIRMVIFLMTIIVVFTVCYTPLMVRILINQTYNSGLIRGGTEDYIDLWALRLACVNQILDPWIYIICRATCCKRPGSRDIYNPNKNTQL